ncbi:MAG: D-alanine--D-alanine ligase [Spirochaetaceae bacterium]|jgi:D-alanine-D-alanine ligase|nr:D-alanine--D-alanine ligase [Spirochaetaceae bacterium]
MNIVILYGGKSGEHEVSLVSASSIVRNINRKKTVHLVGIDRDGCWYLQNPAETDRIRRDPEAILSITRDEKMRVSAVPGGGIAGGFRTAQGPLPCDAVFPVLHGTFGEDGTVQGLLDMAEIPYAGARVLSSAVSMDKEKTKEIWAYAGLPVVPWLCLRKSEWRDPERAERFMGEAEERFSWPLFVKPCSAGSSVGASKAGSREELKAALEEAFLWDNKALVEAYIPAREIECSVTGNSCNGIPAVYIPGEIIPSHEFYDYDAKYTDPDGAALCIPAKIPQEEIRRVQELAVKAYSALDVSGFARIDFFIDRRDGDIYLNEINTIPGFTSISMFPKMCEAGGLAYPDLIDMIIDLAVEDFGASRALRTDRRGGA